VPRVVFIGVLALILAVPTPTRAAIFAWRDTEGVTHFVDNLGNVPSEYRESVVTFVKDWERPAPAESVSPAPAPDPPLVPSVVIIEAGPTGFERGFWEGRQSAMAAQPTLGDAQVRSIVQNVEIITPPQLATMFPFFGPVFPVRVRPHRRHVRAPRFRGRQVRRRSFSLDGRKSARANIDALPTPRFLAGNT
jgi:hypothetical protein